MSGFGSKTEGGLEYLLCSLFFVFLRKSCEADGGWLPCSHERRETLLSCRRRRISRLYWYP